MFHRHGVSAVLSVLVALLRVQVAAAQQLEAGARLRGHATTGRFDGHVAWIRADSVGVTQGEGTVVYAQGDIRSLDVSTSSKRNIGRGLAVGAGLGLVGGLIIISLPDDDRNRDSELEGLQYGVAGVFFLAATAVGAGTGALIKSPRWTRVSPRGLGLSIGF